MEKYRRETYSDGKLVEVFERDFTREEIASQAINGLLNTDKDMARVAEDIISLLVSKNLIEDSEIPQSVKEKMAERQELRNKLKGE